MKEIRFDKIRFVEESDNVEFETTGACVVNNDDTLAVNLWSDNALEVHSEFVEHYTKNKSEVFGIQFIESNKVVGFEKVKTTGGDAIRGVVVMLEVVK